ncbi:MAG: LysR substrate-binding domain-containing protein [Gordonia sp. (in: high G+C Gram-positive bacteria)]|uniref:LysR substrate-binding domain-containing protein n=1 Tax=Gordonia sp. (in: high G+C Gram-positive bacteria) TaxID=84139 RepID=UPI003C71C2DC
MITDPADSAHSHRFRLAYVPGATPAKWVRKWRERFHDVPLQLIPCSVAESAGLLRDGAVDAVVTRIPQAIDAVDPGPHHLIELYEETTVVVLPNDHYLTVADELTSDQLADEQILVPLDDVLGWDDVPGTVVDHRPETTADAVELVAAGTGLLVVPQSLARLHHRRDLDFRPLLDAPTSRVGLVWSSPTSELAEQFAGLVRGRSANSSRGQAPAPKRSAKEKAAAKKANREAAGKVPGKNYGKSAARKRRR